MAGSYFGNSTNGFLSAGIGIVAFLNARLFSFRLFACNAICSIFSFNASTSIGPSAFQSISDIDRTCSGVNGADGGGWTTAKNGSTVGGADERELGAEVEVSFDSSRLEEKDAGLGFGTTPFLKCSRWNLNVSSSI